MADYNFTEIEPRWQRYWEEKKTFKTELDPSKPKFYALDMFPYPSGAGLHVGHPEGYTATDIVSRYKRMKGFNVMHPMGWDAFGLPAEQYAIDTGRHPAEFTEQNIDTFRRQIKMLGFSYDWDKEVNTTDPKYYKWTQWIFIQLFNRGLAYVAEVPVNWCPALGTVLANEEVIDGKSERGGYPVVRKPMRQWMLKITAYADRLLEDLEDLDWPDSLKDMQRNWIGRSEGAEIRFEIAGQSPTQTLPGGEGNTGESAQYKTAYPPSWSTLKDYGSEMRKAPTEAEEFLWLRIRKDKLGVTFRRQHAIDIFIVDFISLERKLIIEVDGEIHKNQIREDKERDEALELLGYKVLRITNDEVLKNPKAVIQKIKEELAKRETYKSLPPGEGVGGAFKVFTTRPDTVFGATYAVLSPEHELVNEITTPEQRAAVEAYKEAASRKSDMERTELTKEKTGVFTGAYAINPASEEHIPIWIADYVLATYGTGAIMAVPGHDERDWEFATKFGLPIREVVSGGDVKEAAYTGNGLIVNSGFLNDLGVSDAKAKIIQWLEDEGIGQRKITYRLRDWLFSRQRYWGEPIPVIHLEDGTSKAIPVSELPLLLPEMKEIKPSGTGESPLANAKDWVNTTDPETGKPARRETNTMPQWAGSCWYYLRYLDPHNDKELVSKEAEKYWMPVDLYVGGAEHAVLHLLYARFWHKVLYDIGIVSTKEPFKRLINQGMILGENNEKMSKSRGNVINPDVIVKQYGADTLRIYEMFMGPLEATKPWSMQNVEGSFRFLNRVYRLFLTDDGSLNPAITQKDFENEEFRRTLHKTIKKVTEDTEGLRFNTAISAMMVFINEAYKQQTLPKPAMEDFVKLLAPYAPHLAEQLWEKLGHTKTISYEPFPKYDETYLIENEFEYPVSVNGKVRMKLKLPLSLGASEIETAVRAEEALQKWTEGKDLKKVIVVPGRIINVVV